MIQELQTERLDINKKYEVFTTCKQGDNLKLKIIVYDKSLPADLSNYTCRLRAFKRDQIPLIQNTNITITNNQVYIECDEQLTTTAGIFKAELQFVHKTTLQKKSSFYIIFNVISSVFNVDGAISTPTCTLLKQLENDLDRVENIGDVLEEAKDTRDDLIVKTDAANTSNENLVNSTNAADNTKNELDILNTNAKVTKNDLDKANTAAVTNKNNLDAANVQAVKNYEALEQLGDATDLAKKVEQNSSQLNENVQEINTIKSAKFVFIGDSYADGYTPEGTVTSWCEFTKQLMGIDDSDYYTFHHGGYGFTNGGFKKLVENAITNISDKNSVKYIIFGGGYNDAKDYDKISENMKTIIRLCKDNFLNAKIIIAPFGWCVEGLTTGVHVDQKISYLINMVLEYQRNAVINGAGYIDGIYSVLHSNKYFSSDYVHPNQNGQYAIALALANYIQTGSFNTVEYMKDEDCFLNNVYENGITSTVKCLATIDCKNTILNLLSGKIQGSFNDVILNGNDILLATVKSSAINGMYSKITIPCKGVLKTIDNKYFDISFTLRISQNKLYLNCVLINNDNTNFETLSFTEINIISVPANITINSLIN